MRENMEDISTVSVIIFIAALGLFALLYEKGKKKFASYLEPLSKEEFPLRDMLPVGFAAMDLSKYQYNTAFDRKNRKYLKELYDPEYVEFYLRVYWAQALTYSMLAILLGALIYVAANDPMVGALVAFGMGLILPWMTMRDLENKVQKRHTAIAMDMPELVNKIVILTGAGLTLQGALSKIANEMYSDRILYRELAHTMSMIDSGESADAAFDRLGTKCNMAEMRRFIAVIIQNIHRGGSDVSAALKSIGDELWSSRKALALRVAEEASTKMLFPMMLMLLAVVLLVVAPAVQSMQI